MPLQNEKFDQHRVDSLRRSLQREIDDGGGKDFEIFVDGIKVVPRTRDINKFEIYEEEVRPETKNLSILIYDGPNTNRNTRYSFTLPGSGHVGGSSSGLGEIDQVIAQKLDEQNREYEISRLKEQLTDIKGQLAEAEDYAGMLKARIKDMEDRRYSQTLSLGEVAGAMLKSIIKQHATRLPGGQALAGLLGADPDETIPALSGSPTTNTASFEKQPEPSVMDEQTRNRLSLIEQMQERFNEQQMVSVFSILDLLTTAPEKIEPVLKQLTTA